MLLFGARVQKLCYVAKGQYLKEQQIEKSQRRIEKIQVPLGATITQWICLRLPSCGPGFDPNI